MKKYFLFIFLLYGLSVSSQAPVYNSEWIDYGKVYYKFKVGSDGLYRISQGVLSSSGMGNVLSEHFQLWRNGAEVPLYISKSSGLLGSGDYIEFYGEMNDGVADKSLYRDADYQLNDKWSLQTDTSSYYLTVNTGVNLRFSIEGNVLPGGSVVAEPYFIHKEGVYYKRGVSGGILNPGYSRNAGGELIYSSSYDIGEGHTSGNIDNYNKTGNPQLSHTLTNLYPYTGSGAPSALFSINVAGNNPTNSRNVSVLLNGTELFTAGLNSHAYLKRSVNFPVSGITSASNGTALLQVRNMTLSGGPTTTDRIVVAQMEVSYPRRFNFGNQSSFRFELPANSSGNYIEITNFNHGGVAPVLYDYTNGKRYEAVVSGSGSSAVLKFSLAPSLAARRLLLVSQSSGSIRTISSLEERRFVDYFQPEHIGDYLIITHPSFSDAVESYASYRRSSVGGGYNVKVYMIDQLEDQFGLGIKMHPNSIRNFLRKAKLSFSGGIKHVLLIGKGVNYVSYHSSQNNPDMDKLAFVPSFGSPASDALLTAEPGMSWKPELSIGRLSVITSREIEDYLNKVKEYEQVQQSVSPSIEEMLWRKNMLSASGGSNPSEAANLLNILKKSNVIFSDTLIGASIQSFSKSSTVAVEPVTQSVIKEVVESGINYMNYIGHSSATTLEFGLSSSVNFNNKGKYYIANLLGCKAGDVFTFNAPRLILREGISENLLLTPERGSVAVISSSNFGVGSYLDVLNNRMSRLLSNEMYGATIGEVMLSAYTFLYNTYTSDYSYRYHVEGNNIMGDPSLRLNYFTLPDYAIETAEVSVSPSIVSVSDEKFLVDIRMLNLGKAVNDSIVVEVKRQYPDNTVEVLWRESIRGIRYSDSLRLEIPVNPVRDKGLNKIIVTLDAAGNVEESFESNNVAEKEFYVIEEGIRGVYPPDYSIMSGSFSFRASTANPFSTEERYRLDIDTTSSFNSAWRKSQELTSNGGVVDFAPSVSFSDSVVYYWRVGKSSYPLDSLYGSQSFQYIAGSQGGYSQAHRDQKERSDYRDMELLPYDELGFVLHEKELKVSTGVLAYAGGASQYSAIIDNSSERQVGIYAPHPGANTDVLRFYIIDGKTGKLWKNTPAGSYGSLAATPSNSFTVPGFFHFKIVSLADRQKVISFLDMVPEGNYIVVVNSPVLSVMRPYEWLLDASVLGEGNTLYDRLYGLGFSRLGDLDNGVPFIFVCKKGGEVLWQEIASVPAQTLQARVMYIESEYTKGSVMSPVFGPARSWDRMHWDGFDKEGSVGEDKVAVQVLGIKANGLIDTLKRSSVMNESISLSDIDAGVYPNVRLRLETQDSVNYTPYQLRYWMVTGDYLPEGAVAPNLHFGFKDTLEVGEPLNFSMAFKSIGEVGFDDSIRVRAVITDRNNVSRVLSIPKIKAIGGYPDSAHINFSVATGDLVGKNILYVGVNPDSSQLEVAYFNNNVYKQFYVFQRDETFPITIESFVGVGIGCDAILSWKVSNAVDFSHFEVEGSIDGIRYEKNETVSYRPEEGIYKTTLFQSDKIKYYRLKMVDIDGTYKYSPYVLIQVDCVNGNIYSVYPNPTTSGEVYIKGIKGGEQIQVYTSSGQLVQSQSIQATTGTHRLDVNRLSAGIYQILVISAEGKKNTFKLVKVE